MISWGPSCHLQGMTHKTAAADTVLLVTHLQGLTRLMRNRPPSPSCCKARWPATEISNLLSMRTKLTVKKKMFAGYILNKFVWNSFDVYNKWWEKSKGCLMVSKILELRAYQSIESTSAYWEYINILRAHQHISVSSILRVKMHARLFKYYLKSHNQSFLFPDFKGVNNLC